MYLNPTFPHVQSSTVHITFFLVFKHNRPRYPNRNPKYKSKNSIKYAGCYYTSQCQAPSPDLAAPQKTGPTIQRFPNIERLMQPELKIYKFYVEETSQLSERA